MLLCFENRIRYVVLDRMCFYSDPHYNSDTGTEYMVLFKPVLFFRLNLEAWVTAPAVKQIPYFLLLTQRYRNGCRINCSKVCEEDTIRKLANQIDSSEGSGACVLTRAELDSFVVAYETVSREGTRNHNLATLVSQAILSNDQEQPCLIHRKKDV